MNFQVTKAQLWRGLDYFDLVGALSHESCQYLVQQMHEKLDLKEKIFHFNRDNKNTYYVFARHGDLVRNGLLVEDVVKIINSIQTSAIFV